MKLIILALLAPACVELKIELKKESVVRGRYVALFDLVQNKEFLAESDKAALKSIYLGAAVDGRVIPKSLILFALRYRGIDASRFSFSGASARIICGRGGEDGDNTGKEPALVGGFKAKKNIRKNQALSKDDFEPIKVREFDGLVRSQNDFTGMKSAKAIRSGETLVKGLVKRPPVVRRGKTIVIRGKFVDNVAKAMSDGAVGDVIRCVVKDIKEPIKIRVVSEGVGTFAGEDDNADVK